MIFNQKIKPLVILSFLIFTLFRAPLFADVAIKTNITKSVGNGEGSNRSEAVASAIAEAVSKISGIKISKEEMVDSLYVEHGDQTLNIKNISSKIHTKSGGKADSYEILSVNELNGVYIAKVEVTNSKTTKTYKTPGLDPMARRSLAVLPSYSSADAFHILGTDVDARDVSQRLTQELVSALTKTRKFTVLDREANEAYHNEKALLLSRDEGKDELLKLGNVLGADYLFLSSITELHVEENVQTSKLTGQTTQMLKAYATVQYRILAMATRQIKWSSTTTFEFAPSGRTFEQIYLEVLQKTSEELTYEIIENIYPLKVADLSQNAEVILSQSSPLGTRYAIYVPGKKLYDSYTKEYLGQDETLAGEIEIVRSLPKISYARVVSGKVNKGDICRKLTTNNLLNAQPGPDITEQDKPSDVKQASEGGGVKLPFD